MTRKLVSFLALLLFLTGCSPAALLPPLTVMSTPTKPVATVQPEPGSPTKVAQPKGIPTDARWIALVAPDGNVYLVDAISGYRKQITEDGNGTPQAGTTPAQEATYYCCFSWSSDGRMLAFRNTKWSQTANGLRFQFSLWMYDTGRDEVGALPQDGNPSGLAFQPGTHLLAYDQMLDPDYFANGKPDSGKAHGITGLNVDTGETTELVKPEHGYSLSEPRWSPDGQVLGFIEQSGYEVPTPFGLYDFRNKVYRSWNQVIGNYTFAPDGQHLAYDRLVTGVTPENERIWVSDLEGKNEQLITAREGPIAHAPLWSPKGNLLAYWLGSPLVTPGQVDNVLVVQPVKGGKAAGEPRQLGRFSNVGPLAWSPDGTQLAFTTAANDQWSIKLVTVIDGSVKDLGTGFDPAWQPAVEPASAVSQAAPTGENHCECWMVFEHGTDGYSLTYPLIWVNNQVARYSLEFNEIQRKPAGMGPPLRLFVSVYPKEYTNQDPEAFNFVYHFIPLKTIQEFMALPVGDSMLKDADTPTPDVDTYTRLPDRVVAGKTALVIENSKVWEAPVGTKERIVIFSAQDTTYLLGMDYETPEQLAMFEKVLDSFQMTQ